MAAGVYAAYVATTWLRYGRPAAPAPDESDSALDRFMPIYDVVDRHRVFVNAPAAATLEAAKEQRLLSQPIVRAIVRTRELLLGADGNEAPEQRGLFDETRAMGWVVLEERAGREVVLGAVTRPWEADVTFRSIAPERFAAFSEPDYVKIVWTLRADPVGEGTAIFRTETRAAATDANARRKFRWYWSFLSPGILLIRWLSLRPLKIDAERRAGHPSRDVAAASPPP